MDRIRGTPGNDVPLLGTAGDDEIFGLEGDDVILADDVAGGIGNDIIDGGPGNDTIDGGITVDFESGQDVVTYEKSRSVVVVDLELGTATDGFGTEDSLLNIDDIVGSRFDDNLSGTDVPNVIEGGPGDDIIEGGGGDRDTLRGNAGDDIIGGGGGEGGDDIFGGSGFDTVSYADGVGLVVVNLRDGTAQKEIDVVFEDTLDDIEGVIGSGGVDELTGDDQDNAFEGLGGTDDIDGGDGRDRVEYRLSPTAVSVDLSARTAEDGFESIDTLVSIEDIVGSEIDGEGDHDVLAGGDGDNVITPLGGDDVVLGLGGNDVFIGGTGDDELGDGSDEIDGGEGRDRVEYRLSSTAVTVDLLAGTAEDSFETIDELVEIEDIVGSEFDDDLAGDGLENEIAGLAGVDQLAGRGGNDVLLPGLGAGESEIDGGAGFDEVSFRDLEEAASVNLAERIAEDREDGEVLIDVSLVDTEAAGGSMAADVLTGSAGDNAFEGFAGNDEIDGGEGRDRVDYTFSPAGVTVDLGSGTAEEDGFGAADELSGIEDIEGSAFDDELTGDDGSNAFEGLAGNDTIAGGGGARDRVDYVLSPSAVEVDLKMGEDGEAMNDGFGTEDTLSDIDDILGSEFDDVLMGDGGRNIIEGLAGNDTIDGRGGADLVDYFFSPGGVEVDLRAGTATETWDEDDFTIRTGLDGPTMFVDDLVDVEDVRGSRKGDDVIRGDDGSNFLIGLGGDDRLSGRDGDDIMVADGGEDVMKGGDGSDTFICRAAGKGLDVIKDFGEEDVIDLRDIISSGDQVRLREDGDNTILRVDLGGDGRDFIQLACLEGATALNLNALIDNGNLVVNDAGA